jgi:hypothetical protein
MLSERLVSAARGERRAGARAPRIREHRYVTGMVVPVDGGV